MSQFRERAYNIHKREYMRIDDYCLADPNYEEGENNRMKFKIKRHERIYHYCALCGKTEIVEEDDKDFYEKNQSWQTCENKKGKFELCEICCEILNGNKETENFQYKTY